MTSIEVIREVNGIKEDFIQKKITHEEVMQGLNILDKNTNYSFSALYNAFYSSRPERYIN